MASTIPQQQQTPAVAGEVGKMQIKSTRFLKVWQEHDNVRTLFRRVIDAPNMEEKQSLFNLLVKELSQHEVAEEVVIHPAFRNLTKDEAVYNAALMQETNFQRILLALDNNHGTKIDVSINVDLENALAPLLSHMEYEESNILPILESRLSREDLEGLNTWYDRIKVAAPTRPHPDGPKSAIGNLAVAPVVTFIDKFRDLAKKFPST